MADMLENMISLLWTLVACEIEMRVNRRQDADSIQAYALQKVVDQSYKCVDLDASANDIYSVEPPYFWHIVANSVRAHFTQTRDSLTFIDVEELYLYANLNDFSTMKTMTSQTRLCCE